MSLSNVQSALIQAYQGAGLSLSTEYENQQFEKPSSGNWASVFFLPTQPEAITLGPAGEDEAIGILQIDLYTERFNGTSEARSFFETLRTQFKSGNRFTYSGQEVVIASCGRGPGQVVDEYFKTPVTIQWRAYLSR